MTIANFSNFHHSFTPLIFTTLNRGTIFLVGQLSGYCFEVIYFLLLNTFWIFWMFVYAFDLANKKTRNNKTDRVRSWIDTQSSLVHSLKRPINYCCRICTILCMILKKLLFIEALCRPLFTKYAHCKPLFQFQNNAWWTCPHSASAFR